MSSSVTLHLIFVGTKDLPLILELSNQLHWLLRRSVDLLPPFLHPTLHVRVTDLCNHPSLSVLVLGMQTPSQGCRLFMLFLALCDHVVFWGPGVLFVFNFFLTYVLDYLTPKDLNILEYFFRIDSFYVKDTKLSTILLTESLLSSRSFAQAGIHWMAVGFCSQITWLSKLFMWQSILTVNLTESRLTQETN